MINVNRISTLCILIHLLVICLITSQASADDWCLKGLVHLNNGDYQNAMNTWERGALECAPKERLRADIQCLKRTKIASNDTEVMAWMLARARDKIPSAQLYVG